MYPSLLRRYLATVADVVFIFALIYIYAQTPLSRTEFGASAWWPLLLFALYEPVCTRAGSTIGQFLLGFRVRTIKGGRKVPVWRGIVRLFSKYLLGVVSFIKMPVHRQRRALHDIISGTIVIEAKPNQDWPSPAA